MSLARSLSLCSLWPRQSYQQSRHPRHEISGQSCKSVCERSQRSIHSNAHSYAITRMERHTSKQWIFFRSLASIAPTCASLRNGSRYRQGIKGKHDKHQRGGKDKGLRATRQRAPTMRTIESQTKLCSGSRIALPALAAELWRGWCEQKRAKQASNGFCAYHLTQCLFAAGKTQALVRGSLHKVRCGAGADMAQYHTNSA